MQVWFRVDFVTKDIRTPATSKTLKFITRTAAALSTDYWPLLSSFSGLGMEMGQDGMPTQSTGSITIDDRWESYGDKRRVFDIFDRCTPIEQTVTVYYALSTIDDLVPSSWTQRWQGVVKSFSKSKEALNFSVATIPLETKHLGYKISEDTADTGFTVPESSMGKTLPIVIGETPSVVPAISIAYSDTDKSTAQYAYATLYVGSGGHKYEENTETIYARNLDGDYVEVRTDASYSASDLVTATADAAGSAAPYHGITEFLVPLKTSLEGAIVTGLRWYCVGQNTPLTPTGKIRLALYKRSGADRGFGDIEQPFSTWEEITSVEVNKADYHADLSGASDFYINAVLEEPVVIQKDPTDYSGETYFDGTPPMYGIGVVSVATSALTSTTDFTSAKVQPKTGSQFYLTATSAGGGWLDPGGSYRPLVGVDVVDFVPTDGSNGSDQNGLGYMFLNLVQENRGDKKCDLQQLDLAVEMEGILDDTSGTITGTPSALITKPHHAVRLLSKQWSGSAWADSGKIDVTEFSSLYTSQFGASSPYPRSVAGFTEGEVTAEETIAQIVKEMCCFLVPLANGKLALWPWGATGSVVKVFDDSNIISVGDWGYEDAASVINQINISYGRNFLNVNDQWEALSQPANSTGVLLANKGASDYWYFLLNNSETLYGKRELAITEAQFIADANTASTRANYLARRHDHPHELVSITVPYTDNLTLKLMDIVDLKTAHGPAYFGSSMDSMLPTIDGEELPDFFLGEYAGMRQRRRCQIIGINDDYSGQAPITVLKLRIISPRHSNDPTVTQI